MGVVEQGEEFIRDLGFKQVRVRYHGNTARIEVMGDDIKKLAGNEDVRKKILKKFKKLGFAYITVDLEGYRTGSMNEPVKS